MKQLSFIKKPSAEYGGSLLKGRRKTERTLNSRKPMHLVLKTQSAVTLFKRKHTLQAVLRKQAKNFGVKIYSESIQTDHWHICLKITNRQLYRAFIRSLTGILARQLGKGLWRLRPYSRIVEWGRDFLNVSDYILLNTCEISGLVPYGIRKHKKTHKELRL